MESEIKYMEVIDPANRTGKVSIPVDQVHNTAGKTAFLNGTADRDLSLCMLFQRGKCRAAAKCHQIHAEREYINGLRSQAKESNCCIGHGDPRAKEDGFLEQLKASKTFVLASNDEAHVLCVNSLARTSELVKIFDQKVGDTMTIPIRKICRLHQKQQCLFGKDCKNIHLCRDVWRSLQSPSAPSQPNTAPAATTTRTPPRSPIVTPSRLSVQTSTPPRVTNNANQPQPSSKSPTPPATPPRTPLHGPPKQAPHVDSSAAPAAPSQAPQQAIPTPPNSSRIPNHVSPPSSPVLPVTLFNNICFSTPESSSPESSPGPSSRSPSPPLLNANAFIPAAECASSCASSLSQHSECCDVLTPNSFGRAQQALRSFFFAWNPPSVL